MLKWAIGAFALPIMMSGAASAACPTFPYIFSNGTTADANQVNADFANVTNCFAPLASPAFTGNVSVNTSSGGYTGNAALSSLSNSTFGWAGSFYNSNTATSTGGALLVRVDSTNLTLASFFGGTTQVGSITTNSSSTSYNTTSDYRLKSNVQPVPDALNRLMQLQPVQFNWKKNPNLPKEDGFLAHEVQAVAPYAVTGKKDDVNEDGSIKPQQVDYSKLVPLLVAAMKEQQTEIDQLKGQVVALRTSH